MLGIRFAQGPPKESRYLGGLTDANTPNRDKTLHPEALTGNNPKALHVRTAIPKTPCSGPYCSDPWRSSVYGLGFRRVTRLTFVLFDESTEKWEPTSAWVPNSIL